MKRSNVIKFWWWCGAIWTLLWRQSLWKTVCLSSVKLKMCTFNSSAIVLLNKHLCWLSSICSPDLLLTLDPALCPVRGHGNGGTTTDFREKRWSWVFIPTCTLLYDHLELVRVLDQKSQVFYTVFSPLSLVFWVFFF